MLKLYMDQHVHAAVTSGLQSREVDVLTAYEDGQSDKSDPDILQRATELGRVLFTQDVDFVEITNEWLETGRDFCGTIYAHQQKATIGQLIDDLEVICQAMSTDEIHNQFIRIPF